MMTREYPPEVYGGAGVHVTELVRFLRPRVEVDVHCMGAPRSDAVVHGPDPQLGSANSALRMLSTQLRMADAAKGADLVHSHTWYTGLAGHLAGELYDVPHILTAHSLEPRRPWKAEQLGGGYRISSWSERNAVEYAAGIIAVSEGMRSDVLDAYPDIDPDRVHVVHNGIDTDIWYPDSDTTVLKRIGVCADRPIVAFVGRITRQKGVGHLLAAARHFDPEIQLVLCAGDPDTPQIEAEVAAEVADLSEVRSGVHWVPERLPGHEVRQVLSAATVFVCPSVYEPLGIVNLEAMACETAVVASDVGGIPEVVEDGLTGRLIHFDPAEPEEFTDGLAAAVNAIARDPELAGRLGRAGRARVVREFTWSTVAGRTVDVYRHVLGY
jgi:starch synthase